MWSAFLAISVAFPIVLLPLGICSSKIRGKFGILKILMAVTFVSLLAIFVPVHVAMSEINLLGIAKSIFLSLFNAIQVFAIGTEFQVVLDSIPFCPAEVSGLFLLWASILFFIAPLLTFGFLLSLFKNLWAYIIYRLHKTGDVYVFSSLNEKSLSLAKDISKNNKKIVVVFTDVMEEDEKADNELVEQAKKLNAIIFTKDVTSINFAKHSSSAKISFFAMGEDESENLDQTLNIVERYRNRKNTHVFLFSTNAECEPLLSQLQRGEVKLRRINENISIINRLLYETGNRLFESAHPAISEGEKRRISAVVVGMGGIGTEMVKALSWYCQMDGYHLKITAFDKDPLAEDKFVALVPELMSPQYNGVEIEGEAQYDISVIPNTDVFTKSFADKLSKITDASYVLVSLGDDNLNVQTAMLLRTYFERMKIHPVIQAIVYDSDRTRSLTGAKNFKGQPYDIEYIGDLDSSYTEKVIIDSELEDEALLRHLRWGKEEDFWTYEYNYRSSMASALHKKAKEWCKIPGVSQKEETLTEAERDALETLEHKRWNAYMRSEGYIYSGSKDRESRNDLAKMHHDLVDFSSLSEEDKRKDSIISTN